MRDGCHIFGNGKSSKTTNKSQHHKFPSGLGYPKPEGKDEGESYTLFRTLPRRFSVLSFRAVSLGVDYVYWKVAVVLAHGAGFVLGNVVGLYRN